MAPVEAPEKPEVKVETKVEVKLTGIEQKLHELETKRGTESTIIQVRRFILDFPPRI